MKRIIIVKSIHADVPILRPQIWRMFFKLSNRRLHWLLGNRLPRVRNHRYEWNAQLFKHPSRSDRSFLVRFHSIRLFTLSACFCWDLDLDSERCWSTSCRTCRCTRQRRTVWQKELKWQVTFHTQQLGSIDKQPNVMWSTASSRNIF